MRNGDEVRVSTPVNTASRLAKPLICLSNAGSASRIAAIAYAGRLVARSRPGLVGGHCIGVDPYYLTHKAEAIGYHPQIILAGRRLNDSMGAYVVTQLVKTMTQRRIHVQGARVLVLGLAFKENCPDLRNTRIVDIVRELAEYDVQADVYDPWVSTEEAQHEYRITPVRQLEPAAYDAIIIAVAHEQFKSMGAPALRALGKPQHVLYDLKYVLPAADSDMRL